MNDCSNSHMYNYETKNYTIIDQVRQEDKIVTYNLLYSVPFVLSVCSATENIIRTAHALMHTC